VFLCSCSFDFEMCATCSPPILIKALLRPISNIFHGLHFPWHILHSLPFFWHLNSRSNRKKPIKFKWLTKNRSYQLMRLRSKFTMLDILSILVEGQINSLLLFIEFLTLVRVAFKRDNEANLTNCPSPASNVHSSERLSTTATHQYQIPRTVATPARRELSL